MSETERFTEPEFLFATEKALAEQEAELIAELTEVRRHLITVRLKLRHHADQLAGSIEERR